MGLLTLTRTPNPMGFLSELLDKPLNEEAFLILPVGCAATNARVPGIDRLPQSRIAVRR